MLNWLKNKVTPKKEEKQYSFKWYELGPENPFNKRILDIRSLTHTTLSGSKDKEIVELYSKLRQSIGDEYKDYDVTDFIPTETNLVYPHNGDELCGIAFKSDCMECKWDVYIYDNYFYFTKSWTGELIFKVKAQILSDKIILDEILHSSCEEKKDVESEVHFLMKSHLFGQPFPHNIPNELTSEKEIAIWSFSRYGNLACYATYEMITDTVLINKK